MAVGSTIAVRCRGGGHADREQPPKVGVPRQVQPKGDDDAGITGAQVIPPGSGLKLPGDATKPFFGVQSICRSKPAPY
jgi:hypothetical protein